VRLRAWARDRAEGQRLLALAERWLVEHGSSAAAARLGQEIVADGRWVERYQERLRPLALGRRFVVVPRATAPAAAPTDAARALDGREVVTLVPGRAFGTGEHATTRLAAARLEQVVARGSRWIDLGCGSAILAVVIARSGAASVLALDEDPEAVAAARETVLANAVADRVRLVTGRLAALGPSRWDGIACNISGRFARDHAASLSRLVEPGGRLLVTGFLEEEASDVLAALAAARLSRVSLERLDGWQLADARRGDDG
jgi:ribosomal protein L11 methyltransferase